MKKKSKKACAGRGKLYSCIVTGATKPGKRRKVPRKVMNRKVYRQRMIAQERALNPRVFRQYARRIVTPRGFALLEQIHAEISPKLPPEILPDIVPPLVRFASRRKGEAQAAQGESRFALSSATVEFGVGAIDRDELAGGEEKEIAPVLPVEPKEKQISE